MIWIYVAAAIFGGAFLIPMVLGGLTSDLDGGLGGGGVDGDFDLDADLDLDVEVDTDLGADGPIGGAGGAADMPSDLPTAAGASMGGAAAAASEGGGLFGELLGDVVSSLISFRTMVFFSGFFGAAGLVFGALGYRPSVTFGTAVLIGTIAAVANSLLFGVLKSSQPNSQISDRTLEGRPATVVLPMQGTRRGRIRVELSGQPQYLVARPMDAAPDTPEQRFDVGASVVVVKIENGTAHVAALPELDPGEEP
jgi:membrane protein implicated in regulation of membrane protease activity